MTRQYIKTPKGNLHERVRVGREWGPYYDPPYNFTPGTKCGDCGAKYGEYHRNECDIEICPICGDQLISCGHVKYWVERDDTPIELFGEFVRKGLRFWGFKV